MLQQKRGDVTTLSRYRIVSVYSDRTPPPLSSFFVRGLANMGLPNWSKLSITLRKVILE